MAIAMARPAIGADAAADFSPTDNPAGPWSYGWSLSLGGAMTLFDQHGQVWVTGVDVWRRQGSNAPVAIFRNSTASALAFQIDSSAQVHLNPGELAFKPGPMGQTTILRWTATQAQQVAINSSFASIDDSDLGDPRIAVFQNGAELFNHVLDGFQDTISFNATLDVDAGDTISFTVSPGSSFDYPFSSASLDVQIVPIATPGDINGDGAVDVTDLLAVIASWGDCPDPPLQCPADIAPAGPRQGDGVVNVNDLLMVVTHWG